MNNTTYTITVFPRKNERGYSLPNVYKRDKNAVLKLMVIRNDYEYIMIRKNERDEYGYESSGPFISWDKTEFKMTAYGKNNLYSKPCDRDNFYSDITPWYILAEKSNRQNA